MENKDLVFRYEGLDHYAGLKKEVILLAAVVDGAFGERAENLIVTLCLGNM